MDEMEQGYRKDQARSARMRAVVDAIDAAIAAGDFTGTAVNDAREVRRVALSTMDHIVAVWD